MKIKNDKTLSGCTVLVRGHGFISNQIALHNKWIAKIEGHKWEDYTHAEKLRWDENEGQLYTFGARQEGPNESKVVDYYTNQKIKILYPKVPLTREENYMLKGFYIMVDPWKYQWLNFILWINDIHLLGKLAPKFFKTKYSAFCYKLVAKADKWIIRWPFGKSTDKVSLFDLIENLFFKTK